MCRVEAFKDKAENDYITAAYTGKDVPPPTQQEDPPDLNDFDWTTVCCKYEPVVEDDLSSVSNVSSGEKTIVVELEDDDNKVECVST